MNIILGEEQMATISMVATIATGIVIIAAAIAVLTVVRRVKTAIDPILTIARHIDPEELENEIEMTPKSVNAMTSVYLTRIQQDFPEFNYYEFKAKAENMMKSALNAITTDDINKLVNASADLTAQINNTISSNEANGRDEVYRNIEIHRTEIKNYRKSAGTCVITLQSSVGYIHYVKDRNGNVIEGSEDHKFQTRYDTDLMYIQDISKVDVGVHFTSNNCPHCGAPIKSIGMDKTCPYCGSGVEQINIRTWSINKLTQC